MSAGRGTSDDRLAWAVFVATLVAGSVFLIVALALPDGGGAPHPEFPTMRVGGTATLSFWPQWLLGTTIICFCAGLILFGARKGGRLRPGIGAPATFVTLILVGAWTWLVLAYGQYTGDETPTFILGLSLPGAIMMYVLFPLSGLFNLMFVAGFDRWIFTPQDEEEFDRLVAAKRADREEHVG